MGLLNKKRVSHYWSKLPGVGDPVIMGAMKQERFRLITSALSFAHPWAAAGWVKFAYVNHAVRAACRTAVGITQHFAIDESMIKCFSRYCSWKQFMPRKPIKTGIKVFSLVLSIGFLYDCSFHSIGTVGADIWGIHPNPHPNTNPNTNPDLPKGFLPSRHTTVP